MSGSIAQFKSDAGRFHELMTAIIDIVFGDADQVVEFEGMSSASIASKLEEFLQLALTAGPTWQTEAEGRSEVGDDEVFRVAGTGDVAISLYKRVNSGTSVLLGQVPSLTRLNTVFNALNNATALSSDSAALAHDWAVKPVGEVLPGQGKSAFQYAQNAANSASLISSLLSSVGIYADYATGLAAVTDGNMFSFYHQSGNIRLIYKRVSGAGELQSIVPARATESDITKKLAGSAAADGSALPSNPFFDTTAIDSSYTDGILANRAASAPDLNLLGASKPTEMPTELFQYQNSTPTYGVNGPEGNPDAMRVTANGTVLSNMYMGGITILPGRWTFAFDIKLNSGADPGLRCGMNFLTGTVPLSLTTSWQTVFMTVVLTAETSRQITPITSLGNNYAYDVSISNMRLIPGSSAGSPSVAAMNGWNNLIRNYNGYFPRRTKTQNQTFFLNTLGRTFSALSVIAVMRPLVGELYEQAQFFGPANFDGTKQFGLMNGTADKTLKNGLGWSNAAKSFMAGISSGDWIVMVGTNGPSGSKVWANGILVAQSSTPMTPSNNNRWEIMGLQGYTSLAWLGDLGSLVLYDRELSDAEAQNGYKVMVQRITAHGERFQRCDGFYIPIGDSITVGDSGQPGFAYRVGVTFAPFLQGWNFGFSGATVDKFVSDATYQAQVLAKVAEAKAAGYTPVVSVFYGANDLPGTTAAADAMFVKLRSTYATLRAAGAKVIACTCIAVNSSQGAAYAAFESIGRPYLNGLIRSGGAYYDALCDFASNVSLNTWSGTYYANYVHPNNAGHQLMAPIMATALHLVVTG